MAEFGIPEQYERGFIEIRQLDEDQVHEIISVLEDAPPMRDRADLQKILQERANVALSNNLDEVMETLISLYALRDSTELAIEDFVQIVDEMVEESEIEEIKFNSDQERDEFNSKLTQLLSVDPLEISTRAADILYEREATIHGTPRIFTDIRPVFGSNLEEGPKGAVLVHTFKIRYHEGREIKELFLGLDTDHVKELIDVLERASSKAEVLKRFLDDKNLPYVDPE